MKLKNLEKKQVDTESYVLYSPDSLNYITNEMCKEYLLKIHTFKSIFRTKEIRKIQVNLFDNKEKFREFVYQIRDDNGELPEYACGTYDAGMINAYIEKNIIVGTPKYINKTHMITHELFHILYLEQILNNDISKRIIWFDEGMAKNISGEKDYLLSKDSFKDYFNKVYEETKIIPNINLIEHGESFYNENYNGYDLSYLCVRYLKETMSFEQLINLMSNFEEIKRLGNTIINDMFRYYKKELFVE